MFGADVRAAALELMSRYPAGQGRSALLPMLHLVQSEQGYVSPDGIAFCAEVLDLAKAQVAAVATFYTMYKRKPTGEYLVSVCTNTLCGLLGGDEIYAALSESLGVGMNETTEDGMITLEHAECLAACDYAPVVTVNYEFFDNQSVESATVLVDALRGRASGRCRRRGAPLCTFKQIERQIAGFYDERPEALEASGSRRPDRDRRQGRRRARRVGAGLSRTGDARPGPRRPRPPGEAADRGGDRRQAAPSASAQPTSAHDAPLKTAESDPARRAREGELTCR